MKRAEVKVGQVLAHWSVRSDYRGSANKVVVEHVGEWVSTKNVGMLGTNHAFVLNGQQIVLKGRLAKDYDPKQGRGVLVSKEVATGRHYFVARLADLAGDWEEFQAETKRIAKATQKHQAKVEEARKAEKEQREETKARIENLLGVTITEYGQMHKGAYSGDVNLSLDTLKALVALAEKAAQDA